MSLGSTAGNVYHIGGDAVTEPTKSETVIPTAIRNTDSHERQSKSLKWQKKFINDKTGNYLFLKAFVDKNGGEVTKEVVEGTQFHHMKWMSRPIETYDKVDVAGIQKSGKIYDYVTFDDKIHVIRWKWVRLCTTPKNWWVDLESSKSYNRSYEDTQFNIGLETGMPGEIDDWYDYTDKTTGQSVFWIRVKVFIDVRTLPDNELTAEELIKKKALNTATNAANVANNNSSDVDDVMLKADSITTDWVNDYYSIYTDTTKAFSLQTFNYIIGLPCQFMEHVDTRWGDSAYGGDYVESILYDAPIATLIPGGPFLSVEDGENGNALKTILSGMAKGYAKWTDIEENGILKWVENEFTNYILGDKYKRFFTFSSDYSRYVQYVNTICQLFIHYLGIKDRICPITNKPYAEYDDTIENIDTDGGKSFTQRYGRYRAIHIYYSPQSSLSTSTSNSTRQSQIMETLNSFSSMAKEAAFLAGAAGISKRSGVTLGETSQSGGLFTSAMGSGTGNVLGTAISRVTQSAETIFSGNALQLPEIYSDSSNGGNTITLDFTLASPYGDEESIFLHELRPLARVMALSYPRQYGPNGYTSPFICQCFAKGQFNCVLGIVEQLQIQRGGNGGEATTGAGDNIPLELNVSLSIKDLYDQVVISNMYENGDGATDQLESIVYTMNNVGLLNFTASFAGYNCNSPEYDQKFEFLLNAAFDKLKENITIKNLKEVTSWRFPKFSRWWKEQIDAQREKDSVWTR